MFTRQQVEELFAELMADRLTEAEIELVSRRARALALDREGSALRRWRRPDKDRRVDRDPMPKPCGAALPGGTTCQEPRIRVPGKKGARLCAMHERARLERLERERRRQKAVGRRSSGR